MTEQDSGNIPARVRALYGKPGFESWAKIANVLRIPRGSGWSLAHGLRKPDARTIQLLEAAEFRELLPQAADNLRGLLGDRPPVPVSYTRAQAAKLVKRRREL